MQQDSKSHHERELKSAELALPKAKKVVKSIVGEAKAYPYQQEMQALQLELEELKLTKSLETQQQQVMWNLL